ncbi:hypothetical protein LINPERPRIM_LOCUS31907 [Linum perenne]
MSSECVPIGTIVEILHRIFVVSIATGEAETSPNLNTHPPSFYLNESRPQVARDVGWIKIESKGEEEEEEDEKEAKEAAVAAGCFGRRIREEAAVAAADQQEKEGVS